jgi:hypothetical protein
MEAATRRIPTLLNATGEIISFFYHSSDLPSQELAFRSHLARLGRLWML